MSAFSSPSTPSTLVGRDRELGVLREHLDAALVGQGSLVLIGGEAGIGKTALAETFCQQAAERGALVLVGRCYDLTETPPYGPWVELFAQYRQAEGMPPLPDALVQRGAIGVVTSQAELLYQLLDFFAALAAVQPVVLLLDDAHWMDVASLDTLRFLARTLVTLPLLLVATYRSDEPTDHLPLFPLLSVLVREAGAARLDVRPLNDDAVRALIDARSSLDATDASRLVDYLHEWAEGNPLFVAEVLRSLVETAALRQEAGTWRLGDLREMMVPPLLRQVIDARVARLSDLSRHLLGVAAVIGANVAYDLWAVIADVDEGTLLHVVAEAEGAHILTENRDGSSAAFVHALLREAIYEGVRPSQRRRWHQAAGETLAVMPGMVPDAVAHHFRQAGDRRAVEWLIRSAERAERVGALLGAARRFAAAADLCAASGDTLRQGWLLVRLAPLRAYDDPWHGLAALEEATRLAGSHDPALAACARYLHGDLLCNTGEFRCGLAEIAEATVTFAALPDADQVWVRASGMVDAYLDDSGHFREPAHWVAFLGRYREAAAMATRAIADLPSPTGRGEVATSRDASRYRALAICHAALGRPHEARAAYAQNRAILRTLGVHPQIAINALDELERLLLPYFTEQVAERRRMAIDAEEAMRRGDMLRPGAPARPQPPGRAHLPVQVLEGRWDAVRETAQTLRATESGTAMGPVAARALGGVACGQGEMDLAWGLVRAALPGGPASEPGDARFFDRIAMQRLAVELALDAGDLPTARAWLAMYGRWLAWSGSVHGQSERQALWARYHRQAGDRERACDHAERALRHATEPRQPLALLTAERVLGELATDDGRWEDGHSHLDAALALADACAAPFERAKTLLALADLSVHTDDRDAALALLDEVRAVCIPLRAQPTLARADALAARIGAAEGHAHAYPAGLSAREVEVLRLLASGRTNRDIAAALFLSKRTVDAHVRTILTKTDTDNRAAAARWASEHALT